MSQKMGRQIFAAEVEEVEDGTEVASVTAMVSTPDVTRGGELVLPTAFEARLASYLANPMFMWGHAWHGGPESILGRAASVRATSKGLRVKLDYHLKVDGQARPLAQEIYGLVKAGLLRAFSIGFWPHKYVTKWSDEEAIAALPKFARQALEDGGCWCVHTEVELMEISQVLVPANRETVMQAHAAGLCSPEFTRHAMHELLGASGGAVGRDDHRQDHSAPPEVMAADSNRAMTDIVEVINVLAAQTKVLADVMATHLSASPAGGPPAVQAPEDPPAAPAAMEAAPEPPPPAAPLHSIPVPEQAQPSPDEVLGLLLGATG